MVAKLGQRDVSDLSPTAIAMEVCHFCPVFWTSF